MKELVCNRCGRDDYSTEYLSNYLFVGGGKLFCSNCDTETFSIDKKAYINIKIAKEKRKGELFKKIGLRTYNLS
tara:strand:- start:4157 stop:4378 length:222 start_codon:yes stop_codon:yes gene_type:complete